MALLAFAFRYRSKPVAGWMIWWYLCSLITGFEILLRTSITNPFQAVALIAVLMLALVISWSVILSPLGLIWFLKVFVEPHPNEPPRRQVLVSYLKSGVKVILVWCAVTMGGAALGVALGLGSRALGEIYGWTATLEFNLGVRAALGVIGGTITGLAMTRASRHPESHTNEPITS